MATTQSPVTSNDKRPTNGKDIPSSSRAKPKKPHPKITRAQLGKVAFYLIWAIAATYAGQLIAFWLVRLVIYILGGVSSSYQTIIVFFYDLLAYALAFALLIFVPPALLKLYQKKQQPKTSNNGKSQQLEKELSTNAESLGVQRLPSFIDIGLAPIGYVIYLFIANVLTQFMNIFAWFNPDQAQDVGFSYFVTGLDRIFALLAVVILAPIAEELMMRGWLYGKVRTQFGAITSSLLISVVFGFMHGQWNVGITTFALSMVLCSLREITGTVWSGILLHMLSNGIAFYLLYVAI